MGLNSNNLESQVPSNLGALTNLRALSLHDNQLTGALPSEIGLLSKLEYLTFYGTGITKLPDEICNLHEDNMGLIQHLYISEGMTVETNCSHLLTPLFPMIYM